MKNPHWIVQQSLRFRGRLSRRFRPLLGSIKMENFVVQGQWWLMGEIEGQVLKPDQAMILFEHTLPQHINIDTTIPNTANFTSQV